MSDPTTTTDTHSKALTFRGKILRGAEPAQPLPIPPTVEVRAQSTEYAFKSLFSIRRALLRHRRYDGTMSREMTRVYFERGDSVGVVLYDPDADAVVLVRQFRYPAYAALSEKERQGEGAARAWLWEVVAGVQDAGLSPEEVARKELLEEAGYTLRGELRHLTTFYLSPGGTSERLHLFLAEVTAGDRTAAGGGAVGEGEDIEVQIIPLDQALAMVASGEIDNATAIIALQHLALRRAGLGLWP